MKQIYLDNAATTPLSPEVLQKMKPYFMQKFGNASEPHSFGQEARIAVEQARKQVADAINSAPFEITLTSCATESINLAHKGLIEATTKQSPDIKPHIITTSIEHKAVLETCRHLEEMKLAEVTYLPVDQYGLINIEDLKKSIKPNTALISVMYVNNEVGTIQPIEEIGQLVKEINKKLPNNRRIYFHTDATQAIGHLNCDVSRLNVDLLSLTAHKFHGPKGIGVLFVKSGTPLRRQQDGGNQESGLRSGTENVPYIVGLGHAIELISSKTGDNKVTNLRDRLIQGVLNIDGVRLTGHPTLRAPHLASFTVENAEGEAMILLLSDERIYVSSGSACISGISGPSHVLSAMGVPAELSHGSLRISLSNDTSESDIEHTIKVLRSVIVKLRRMSPLINELSLSKKQSVRVLVNNNG